MKNCPICGGAVDHEPACPSCGFRLQDEIRPAPPSADTPAPATAAEIRAAVTAATSTPNAVASRNANPVLPAAEDKTAAPKSQPIQRPPQPAQPARRSRAMIGIAAAGMGAMVLLVLATRAPATSNEAPGSVAAAPVQRAAAAREEPAPAEPEVAPTVNWVPHRGRHGANAIVFELAANEEIVVRRKRVRPMLAVRCVAKTADVYVVTHTAAAFERVTNQHTVHMSFDGGQPITEMWDHSVDHDALFAENSKTLVKQIAGARMMSFTFSPFNASPTTVNFGVHGLDARLESAARTCGWTSIPPSARR